MTTRVRTFIHACMALLGLFLSQAAFSQRTQGGIPFRTPGNDSMKVVKILNAQSYHSETKPDSSQLTFLVGEVKIQQENTIIMCDSMILDPKNNFIESFGHVHINDNDSTNIFSDYMKYEVDKKTIHFLKNVRLEDNRGTLTTQELNYDMNQKVGTYEHGGKINNKGSVLTSERGIYYETTKDVYFRNNVVLRDPQYDLSADSLLYNTATQRSTFITETFILFKDSTRRTVRTKEGYYDLPTHKAYFGKRSVITDGGQKLVGDSVNIDDSTGISTAIGNARYSDSVEGVAIVAGRLYNNKKKNYFLATEKPIMILKQDKDSIYIAADTFYSARLIDRPKVQEKVETLDSLHREYVDSLYKNSSDSLHRAATEGINAKDTLSASSPDSTHPMVVRVRGDSMIRPPLDSTAQKLTADSLSKRLPDSTQLVQHIDSLSKKLSDSSQLARLIDSTKRADSTLLAKPKGKRNQPPGRPTLNKPGLSKPGQLNPNKPGAPPPMELEARATPPVQPAKQEPDRDHEKYTDTAKAPITDSTLRYILAYHHVRIFSDSLQAVADSMYYSGQDSVFRLFYNPIAWGSGNYQITGDTMYVYTKNKKANRMYVFENGLAINKVARDFYNQIKGTTINAYFKDGQVDYMRAKGNAESIYYVQDDNKAYTGVNKAHADIIDMIFAAKSDTGGRELRKVILRNDAEGSMIPFKKVNFDDMRLRGFKWQEARRPKTKEELFE
ncbi:MAG TPA: OstA-like protein [Puia sp.]|nr:OstA-like protein [Puia sp.]